MKTLEEFVKEINGSEELQKALAACVDKASLEAFLKKNGCGATAEAYADYVNSLQANEIRDDDAEAAAGGMPGGLPTPPRRVQKPQGLL